MQKLWNYLQKHSKKIGAVALAVALVGTLWYMAIPRRNDIYHPAFDDTAARAYIKAYRKALPDNYDGIIEKDAFSYENLFSAASYAFGVLPEFLLESHVVVRGKITGIEYVPQIEDMSHYLPLGGHFMLIGGPHVFYDLQVTGQLLGNLGLNRSIRVMLPGTPDTRANPRLAVGDEVVFMLVETLHRNLYYPTHYEHGLFEIEADGSVYVFSNHRYINDFYNGQPAKKLLKDIKTMKRKMGLW